MSDKTWSDLRDDVALRLWEGDESVITVIFSRYAPAMEECLFRKYRGVLTREDIEDAIAIAVKALWDYRSRYEEAKGTVWTLLYRMADRKSQDIIALGWQKARRLEEPDGESLLIERAVKAPSPSDAPAPSSKLLQDLAEVVADLPDDQRRILIAKAFAPDGEVTAGILGEELGLPEGTVRVYFLRAKQKVKQEMARRGHNLS